MPIFVDILVYSFIAGLSTIAGVYLVRCYEEWTRRNSVFLISFAVGVLLATVFFELLPEAIKFTEKWSYWVLGTIIVFYLLEHLIIIHTCREPECDIHNIKLISVLGIGLHSFADGVAIGAAFHVNFVLGLISSLAVIFHEFAEGIFTYTLLIHDQIQKTRAMLYSWLVALATPLGAVITYFFLRRASESLAGALLSLTAGSFIYIGSSDLVPATHKRYNWLNIILFLVGVGFVLFLKGVEE